MVYRNFFRTVAIGFQLQARNALNNKAIDGCVSVQIRILKRLKAGLAFNRANVDELLITDIGILGLNGQPSYFTVGLSYLRNNLVLGAVYSKKTNGNFTDGLFMFRTAPCER